MTKMATCTSKITLDVTKATDKAYLCTYAQSCVACFLACACSDPTYKAQVDKLKSTFAAYLSGCNVTCKTGSAIQLGASIWTVALSVVVGVFALC
jgi:hypothetical protein